jgi:uncharacterized protein YdaU (DUF1376 family)
MAEFPMLPFWTDSWLSDTAHLSFEERGLYLDVLVLMWRLPNCQMPSETKWLERRYKNYADAVRSLCEEFCYLTEDRKFWRQKRLRREYDFCLAKSKKASENAKSRWDKEEGQCDGNADAMQTQCSRASNATYPTLPTIKESKRDSNFGRKATRERPATQSSVANGSFMANPNSPEFNAWVEYTAKTPGQKFFHNYLTEQRAKSQPYPFTSQWPPGYSANGKAAP